MCRHTEIVRRAHEGRIGVDSPSESELEDVDMMSDPSSPETSDGGGARRQRMFINGFQTSRSSRRKFFRSPASFAPIQRDVQSKISSMSRFSFLPPNGAAEYWKTR